MSDCEIVRTVGQPQLESLVAGWLYEAFWRYDGYTLRDVSDFVTSATAVAGPNQCFVLLEGGTPVGTASLTNEDLAERPELTPWLAGVFVAPEARGRGLVRRLITAVEVAAQSAGHRALWLYTSQAERIYQRAGWNTVEVVGRPGKRPVALMRRDLAGCN
jgi:GNAT superfamily N-acetyltransferase